MNVHYLAADQRGSITVEFIFVSLMMVLFINLLIGLAQYQAMSGKLDRVVYSINGVLRERTQLYNANFLLEQTQADQLLKLAQKIMMDTNSDFDLLTLSLTVEALHFGKNSATNVNIQSFTAGSVECSPYQSLDQISQLSPKKQNGSKIPLYQVTLCMTSPSPFKKLINMQQIKSFSVMFAR